MVMGGYNGNLSDELQEALDAAHGAPSLAASVEILKTRKAAHAMSCALHQGNPKLAKALIDDRDEVVIALAYHVIRPA